MKEEKKAMPNLSLKFFSYGIPKSKPLDCYYLMKSRSGRVAMHLMAEAAAATSTPL